MEYDLSALVQQIRLAYAEHLMRCTDLPPTEMEELLSLDGDRDAARRWLAFGYAKHRYDPDHVRGLLVYLFSNYYPSLGDDPAKGKLLRRAIARKTAKLSELTIEKISGTRLDWSEVFQLVGKEFNPTRVKERILKIYEELKGADHEHPKR
ncbi:hypothetical protein HRbin07_00408 [bacterium HR07]|nr:hypothetical protein HRbin07_00408 [bacterium HR07]